MLNKLFRKRSPWVYKLLDKPEVREVLGVWEKHLWHYTNIVGYTATGAIFLCAPDTSEYIIFYPSMPGNNCKSYGKFDSVEEFEDKILKEESFPDYGLYPINRDDLNVLNKKLGPLGEYQIYYPVLDPALGGSFELNNFDKGNIWVRTDILGQNRGIE